MKVLVTGGGGFLGSAVVQQLLARGYAVRTLQRSEHPLLEKLGVEVHRGDLQSEDAVDRAVAHVDAVIHTAARAGVWGDAASYHGPNVTGTRNLLESSIKYGVHALVYTSSPSVVFSGQDENGIDERAPYPETYLTHYPRTKAIAERMVLQAHGADIVTTALRPHLIWGPGDPHLVPRIISRARTGRLRLVGRRDNLVDSTYIDNAATAHVQALECLLSASPDCGGKVYFISNGEPLPMADLINRILAAADLPPVTRYVSASMAYRAGAVFETLYRALGRKTEPPMTRFVARQLATAHYYDISAARRDFGYVPAVCIDEGMQRLAASLRVPASHDARRSAAHE